MAYKYVPVRPVRADFVPAPDLNSSIIKELLQMHTWKRPGGSKTEKRFCDIYIKPLGGYRDEADNYIVTVGENPTVLWSSHTDTVHSTAGKQKLTYGAGFLGVSHKEAKIECLGADCTVGVWIMRQMILRQIPGLYIFHAYEETGASGSRHIANKTPELLKGINYAIAFDRKGINSVITHQFSRCASDEFGIALSAALSGPGLFEPDDTGTFTDTANYTDIVPECTNISVGYWGQHTPNEVLDVGFAEYILNRVCALDVNALPVKRDPNAVEPSDYTKYYGSQYSQGGGYGSSRGTYVPRKQTRLSYWEEKELDDLIDIVSRYPNLVARYLLAEGVSANDIDMFDAVSASQENDSPAEDPLVDDDGVLDLTRQDRLDEGC